MNQPWVYMCSPSWTASHLPPSHPSGSSQCTSPEHPVSCIEPGLAVYFTYGNIHASMLFSQIIPPSPSPTESNTLFFTSVSLLLSHIQGHWYHLSKFHIYALVYCIGVFNMLSRLVITFLPRSKHLLISWLQSPSTVILEPRKIKSATVSLFPHLFAVKWWDQMPWS